MKGRSAKQLKWRTTELNRPLPPAPLGSCMLPIVESYLAKISSGMRILDIGCGSWSRIKRHCDSVGATYEGIDVLESYFGLPTVATPLENLADLSFPDNTFEVIISNQAMEHWGEFGCSIRSVYINVFGCAKSAVSVPERSDLLSRHQRLITRSFNSILHECWHFTTTCDSKDRVSHLAKYRLFILSQAIRGGAEAQHTFSTSK